MATTSFMDSLTVTLFTMFFMVSTIFGLMHYWNEAKGEADKMQGLDTKDASKLIDKTQDEGWFAALTNVFASGFIDYIANALSWLSPFALVKGLISVLTVGTPEIYTFVDYFFLRPIGWMVFFIQFEWTAYYIRGKGF